MQNGNTPTLKPVHLRAKAKTDFSGFLKRQAQSLNFDENQVRRFESVYLNGKRVSFKKGLGVLTIGPEDLLKVYPVPKRFDTSCLSANSILFEDNDLLVIDKPSGVPSLPVASNSVENCKSFFEQVTGSYLYPLHRLDEGTCGVLAMAKSKPLARAFQRDVLSKKVEKRYLAKLEALVPVGLYQSFLLKGKGKMLVFDGPITGSKPCWLEVESCISKSKSCWATVRLITGRTHQIRAQLSHLGAPLIGDPLYGSKKENQSPLFLCATELRWRDLVFQSKFFCQNSPGTKTKALISNRTC